MICLISSHDVTYCMLCIPSIFMRFCSTKASAPQPLPKPWADVGICVLWPRALELYRRRSWWLRREAVGAIWPTLEMTGAQLGELWKVRRFCWGLSKHRWQPPPTHTHTGWTSGCNTVPVSLCSLRCHSVLLLRTSAVSMKLWLNLHVFFFFFHESKTNWNLELSETWLSKERTWSTLSKRGLESDPRPGRARWIMVWGRRRNSNLTSCTDLSSKAKPWPSWPWRDVTLALSELGLMIYATSK